MFTQRRLLLYAMCPALVTLLSCTRESAPRREFKEKCAQLEQEMTVAEVDAILNTYPGKVVRDRRTCDKNGKELSRPAEYLKQFDDSMNNREGDLSVWVYFDDHDRVVGKNVFEWLK